MAQYKYVAIHRFQFAPKACLQHRSLPTTEKAHSCSFSLPITLTVNKTKFFTRVMQIEMKWIIFLDYIPTMVAPTQGERRQI